MLRNGEKMISVRMLPRQLGQLAIIVANMAANTNGFWQHRKVTRSAAILSLIDREAIRIEEVARLKAEGEAAQKISAETKEEREGEIVNDESVVLPTFDALVHSELMRACAIYPPHENGQKTLNAIHKELRRFMAGFGALGMEPDGEERLLALVKIAAICWRVSVDSGVLLKHGAGLDAERY